MIYKSNEPRVTQEDIQNSGVVAQKCQQSLRVCITIQVSTVAEIDDFLNEFANTNLASNSGDVVMINGVASKGDFTV